MKNMGQNSKLVAINLGFGLLVAAALLAYFRLVALSSEDLRKARFTLSLVEKAELNFDRMTIGMRGFMLDPRQTDEWANKLKADETAMGAMKEAIESTDDPKIAELIKAMSGLDEKMDALENQFGEFVKANRMDYAKQFYFEKYLPVRQTMSGVLEKAKEAVNSSAQLANDRQSWLLHEGAIYLLGFFAFMSILNFWLTGRVQKQLNDRIFSVASDLNQTVSSIESASKGTATVSQQVASSTTESASAITETLSIADMGQKEAERGRATVTQMTQSMREVSEANQQLESLIKVIDDIKSKTKVINDIVFETRLLSFNASIEAARAGIHGKGFAVVAEEVGKLAAVSGKAAEEIHELLENSARQVRSAVATTSERVGQARVYSDQCEKVFHSMGSSLSEINKAMNEMERETHQYSASAEELASQASILARESMNLSSLSSALQALMGGGSQDSHSVPAKPGTVAASVFNNSAVTLSPEARIKKAVPTERRDERWRAS